LLSNVQVGCKSYDDLRRVNGHVYDSYREACGALCLLEDDREFIGAINEVGVLASGMALRRMYAKLLLSSSMSDPLNVWEHVWQLLSDDIVLRKRRLLKNPG
jgi:hypothetical protein